MNKSIKLNCKLNGGDYVDVSDSAGDLSIGVHDDTEDACVILIKEDERKLLNFLSHRGEVISLGKEDVSKILGELDRLWSLVPAAKRKIEEGSMVPCIYRGLLDAVK